VEFKQVTSASALVRPHRSSAHSPFSDEQRTTMEFKNVSEIDEEITATELKIGSVDDPSGAGKPLKDSLERTLKLLKGAKLNSNKTINVDDNEQVPKRFKTSNDVPTKKFKLPTSDKLHECDLQSQSTAASKRNGCDSQYHPASNVSNMFQEVDHNVVEFGIGVSKDHTKEGM
jgi:hypothetical protein